MEPTKPTSEASNPYRERISKNRPWAHDRYKRAGGVNSALEHALHNDLDPKYEIKRETTKHRVALFMASQGKGIGEIAERLGLSRMAVTNLLRQPWARERIVEEIQEAGVDELRKILAGEAKASITKLVELRDNADSAQVQLAAADKLLDRFLGKPTQPIRDETDPSKLKEMSDADLARLASQGRATTTGTTSSS